MLDCGGDRTTARLPTALDAADRESLGHQSPRQLRRPVDGRGDHARGLSGKLHTWCDMQCDNVRCQVWFNWHVMGRGGGLRGGVRGGGGRARTRRSSRRRVGTGPQCQLPPCAKLCATEGGAQKKKRGSVTSLTAPWRSATPPWARASLHSPAAPAGPPFPTGHWSSTGPPVTGVPVGPPVTSFPTGHWVWTGGSSSAGAFAHAT